MTSILNLFSTGANINPTNTLISKLSLATLTNDFKGDRNTE